MLRIKGLSVATYCLILALPSSATADPIAVTGGTFSIGFGRGAFRSFNFSLLGDQDFAVTGVQPDGPTQPFLPPCNEFGPCSAGATTSPSGDVRIVAIGSATINGTRYPLTQYFGSANDRFSFSAGDVLIPDGSSSSLALRSPFTFAGSLDVFALDASNQFSNVGLFSLAGQGTATTNLRRFGNGYAIEGVT